MNNSHVIYNNFIDQQCDSRFLFPNPLLALGEFLAKFSENAPFPVSVRSLDQGHDINHMKIIMHNKASAEARGFKEGGKLGMTIPQVLEALSIAPTIQSAELKQIAENDVEVLHHNCQKSHMQTTLDSQGYVRIYQRIVTPISGYKTQPVAISTFSLERTHSMNLLQLFQLYKKYYNQNNLRLFEGIKKCFYYLKLDRYFSGVLNYNEMVTLFTMVSDARHKEAADLMSQFTPQVCTPRNIASYVSMLKEKLKEEVDLYTVLRDLRNHEQAITVV